MPLDEPDRFNIFVSDWKPSPGRVDPGTVVCAIGDVHGQLGHLLELVGWLSANVLCEPAQSRHLVALGDYVDRGPAGIGVLNFLGRLQIPGVDIVRLCGNHDLFLDQFLNDPDCDVDFIVGWMENGGTWTLEELGIPVADIKRYPISTLRANALERIGDATLRYLTRLRLSVRIGSYLFVHAGVHPTKTLDLEDVDTLTWIRDPFLSGAGWRHDFVVVHGHTPCGPEVKKHRIACDSGAFYTGVLTAAEFRGDTVRFIAATPATDLGALERNVHRAGGRAEKWHRVR